ncbi:hypothetical protein [Actinomadura sp. HBU206391]|uniref:hypothetical protein n=1 Tax=Actinomadura sp. HBU206391 TaxID=2731692 RepID=UPI00164F4A03|nr:hypothetical protein [Actinomadura sp. HBU206391]MBC6460568.1 hypothetical protein [Actinomadura sp. HBU206391]
MTEFPVRLKVLLRERHWQTYRTFCTEYDKAARAVDPDLVGGWPSRAQLHRWLSGEVKGLPYPDHCRILEKMFPGWSAEQLFERYRPEASARPETSARPQTSAHPETSARPGSDPAESRTTDVGELLGIIEDRVDARGSGEPAWGDVPRVPATAGAGLRSVSDVLSGPSLAGVSDHARELGRKLLELQQLRRLSDAEIRELAGLAGQVVELTSTTYVHIDTQGRATAACRIDLLNLTDEPISRMTREVSFEHTGGPLGITPAPDSDRRVEIQLINDTTAPARFVFEIFPQLRPGESARIGYMCENGRFDGDHRWRQRIPRHTRQYTLRIRQQNVDLAECTAMEEHPDGSQTPATDGLMWDIYGDDVTITLTRDYLRPNQALTLRWK